MAPLIDAGVGFELAIGNHDTDLRHSDEGLEEIEAELRLLGTPSRYYSTTHGPADFFFLDSSVPGVFGPGASDAVGVARRQPWPARRASGRSSRCTTRCTPPGEHGSTVGARRATRTDPRPSPRRPRPRRPRPPLRAHASPGRDHLRRERRRLQDHVGRPQLVHRGGSVDPAVPHRRHRRGSSRGPLHPGRRRGRRPFRCCEPGRTGEARHRRSARRSGLRRDRLRGHPRPRPRPQARRRSRRHGRPRRGGPRSSPALLLGVVHAVVAGSRLRSEERIAVRRADMWIAASRRPRRAHARRHVAADHRALGLRRRARIHGRPRLSPSSPCGSASRSSPSASRRRPAGSCSGGSNRTHDVRGSWRHPIAPRATDKRKSTGTRRCLIASQSTPDLSGF